MINIQQRPSKKCAGCTSLWISFDFNQKIIDIIKLGENAVYHKNIKEWEMPLNKLSYLIDSLTFLDDITLSFYNDSTEVIKQKLTHDIEPFKHQEEGIDWMINHNSGLLLDSPGLGKTMTTIYTAEELKAQKGISHCLIICGINTLKQNWKKEIQKFSKESCRVIGERINRNGRVVYSSVKDRAEELYNPIEDFFVILNIESLRDSLVIDAIQNSKNKFDMVVLDECHKCKDNQSAQSKGLLKIANLAKYKYGLTGTLLINSPLDAYMPMRFIGHEKASFTNFKQFYCNISMKFGHYQIDGFKNLDILKEELGTCSLRRTKDLLDLPPKIIVPEYIEMESNQEKFYSDLHEGVITEADRVNIKTTSLLGLVTRLRQAATCPSVLSSNEKIKACKTERALELISEITSNNEKVVVFSTFKEPLYHLNSLLKRDDVLICTGDQSDETVSTNIDKFQNDSKYKILLATSAKMATGVTLNSASYEILLDSPWTSSDFEQMCDRIHRIGTKSSVTIYNLIARNTIDERIWELVNNKKAMSEYIIDDNSDAMTENEKVRYLLGL